MDYVPHSPSDIKKLMDIIGIKDISELYHDIPREILLTRPLIIEGGWSEFEVSRRVSSLASQNNAYCLSLAGAGSYFHYAPAVIHHILLRSEFFTAYTPYQAEISQGMLQAIFEYQSMICALTGMDVSNASMYDGASATAEACIMSLVPGANEFVIVDGLHPEYEQTVGTYLFPRGVRIIKVEANEADIKGVMNENVRAVVIQNPNFFGEIADVEKIVKVVKEANPNANVIQVITDMTSLGILRTPRSCGVDIVACEAQALGLAPSFGGPTLGTIATVERLMRKMPGRIVGETVDHDNRRGYVLTLQAREQHIRREKATSNICTNEALCMLGTLVYLASVGATGLRDVAEGCYLNAKYLREQFTQVAGIKIISRTPSFHEFVVEVPNASEVRGALAQREYCPPVDLGAFYPARKGQLLFCVSELFRPSDLDEVALIVKEAMYP